MGTRTAFWIGGVTVMNIENNLNKSSLSIQPVLPNYQVTSKEKLQFIMWLKLEYLINDKFIEDKLLKLPDMFICHLSGLFKSFVKNGKTNIAKEVIEKLVKLCGSFKLNPTLKEKAVALLATECASICEKIISGYSDKSLQAQIDLLERELDSLDVSYSNGKTQKAIIARYCCGKWWNRKLRTIHFQNIECIAQLIGLVNGKRQKYVTNYSVECKKHSYSVHKTFFNSLLAMDETGTEHELIDFVQASLSNPSHRQAELMMRMFGAAKYAQSQQYNAHLVTILCPKEMKASYNGGRLNRNYINSSAREANDFINKVWKNTRSALDKKTKNYFGFRVAEPCKDGSPHWHMVVYSSQDETELVISTLRKKINQLYRFSGEEYACKFHCKKLNEESDVKTALHYLLKSTKQKIEGDSDAKERISTWASANKIRQYAQFGLPPIGLIRTARKLAKTSSLEIRALWNFSLKGDWLSFIENIGWKAGQRTKLNLKLYKKYSTNTDKYGDPYGLVTVGLKLNGVIHETQVQYWQIKFKGNTPNQ